MTPVAGLSVRPGGGSLTSEKVTAAPSGSLATSWTTTSLPSATSASCGCVNTGGLSTSLTVTRTRSNADPGGSKESVTRMLKS